MSAHWNKLLGHGRSRAGGRGSSTLHGDPSAPERGHSCPQHRPNAPRLPEFGWFSFRSTLLRTRMSALRGCGFAALRNIASFRGGAVMASVLLGSTMLAVSAEPEPPSSPQQFYNQ